LSPPPAFADQEIKKILGNTHIDETGDEPNFGWSLQGGFDFNDDGDDDLLIGARLHDLPDGTVFPFPEYPNAGAAYVYYGPLDGGSLTSVQLDFPKVPDELEMFGTSVAFTNSFNAGSVADLIVGAPGQGSSSENHGRAYVYYGGDPPATAHSVTLSVASSDRFDLQYFGAAVTNAANFDEDEYHDIAVGAPVQSDTTNEPGSVFVFYGSSNPSGNENPDVIIDGENEDDHFGTSVHGGYDIVGDSKADLIVGAPNYDSGANLSVGRAYVFAGHHRESLPEELEAGSDAHATLTGEDAADQFGAAVAIVGDVNGDGTLDVAVGAPEYGPGASTLGAVYMFLGGAGLSGSIPADEASMRIVGGGADFGIAISAAGDLNADGFDDFVIGAPDWTSGGQNLRGQAYVMYGGDRYKAYDSQAGLVSKDYTELAVDLYLGDDTGDAMGRGLAAVGDINDDGLDDLAVSAPVHDESGASGGAVFIFDSALSFKDVSEDSEMDLSGDEPYASAVINYDQGSAGDKGPDLVVTFDDERGRLYRNDGFSVSIAGQFVYSEQQESAFGTDNEPADGSKGIAIADYNNDGEFDIFVAHNGSPSEPKLYKGVSNDTFTDVTSSEISGADKSVAAAWGDYDRDGYLDLYVVRATGTLTPAGIIAQQDRLFHSEVADGNGFDDVTADTGIGLKTSNTKTIAASWADVDMDKNLDLYVASLASGTEYGTFYHNVGEGEFEDRTASSSGPGIGNVNYATGLTWADLDRDQDLDLIVSRVDPSGSAENIMTHENDGSGYFTATQIGGIDSSDPMNGVMAVDYDLNGVVDLLGAPRDADQAPLHAGYEPASVLTFLERGERVGLTSKATAGIALYDHDEDGDLEAFLGRTHSTTAEDFLFEAGRNAEHSTPAATWIGIKLKADKGGNNYYGIGARITAENGAIELIKEMGSAAGRGGQDQLIAYFGFGEAEDDVDITVEWPDGKSQSVTYSIGGGLNQINEIEEDAHVPNIKAGTFEFFFQPKPGELVDWVIQWETHFNSDPSLLEVTVDEDSKNGGGCFSDPNFPVLLTAANGNVETSVSPLANGR